MFHLSEQSCNNFNDAFLAAGLLLGLEFKRSIFYSSPYSPLII